ncbi:hypothetical protein F53441_12588 [Fusarium austroafricanum]|uniref:BTB domain-containing protein n=1 Tax=Fusarium austroafricanum TaxID=2364996 RepID=A0A8H4JWR6_9HYPO|nr:hypothetical protein F53441_12588 [Fusarium austroafricanum]
MAEPQDIDIPDAPAVPLSETSSSKNRFKESGDEEQYAVDSLCASSNRAGFRHLLNEGKYSDMTIICAKDEFKVHRAVVCTQSTWFEEAMATPPKKKTKKSVTLAEDPLLIPYLLEFLYTGTYSLQNNPTEDAARSKEIQERLDTHPRCPIPKDSIPKASGFKIPDRPVRRSTRIMSHTAPTADPIPNEITVSIKLFLMAEKYDLPALALLARDRFYTACKARWVTKSWKEDETSWQATQEFEEIVLDVYTSTEEVDTPLWKALCKLVVLKKENDMMKKRMGAVVKEQAELAEGIAGYMLEWGAGDKA